ncbi:MAG: hypothetical protein H8E40_11835 [Chloroflexi bacterium]|nr:hypothetical protein [Chloroflexota bacterium]
MFLVYLLLILLLGVGLLIFGIRKLSGKLRKFVILTGSSAVGFFVFVHLHNLVYGLFIHLFGEDFWNGGDEPVFFILALLCALGFIVGAIGSVVLAIRSRLKR